MLLPYRFDMIVVVFLCNLQWLRQESHNLGMLFLVRPVGSAISECITQIEIDILGNEELYNFGVALACSNVQAGETALVFNLRVSTTVHKLLKRTDHVLLSCEMHGSVATNVNVILNVRLGFVLQ